MIVVSQVKPLLEVTKQEEKLTQKEDELKQVREKLDSQMRNSEEYERRMQLAVDEKNMLQEQLQAEVELCAEAEEMRARYNCPLPLPVLALCALLVTTNRAVVNFITAHIYFCTYGLATLSVSLLGHHFDCPWNYFLSF